MRCASRKRSVVINGRHTSLSLEEPFWNIVRRIAREKKMTIAKLVEQIDSKHEQNNLSSAVRVYILDHFLQEEARLADFDAMVEGTAVTSVGE